MTRGGAGEEEEEPSLGGAGAHVVREADGADMPLNAERCVRASLEIVEIGVCLECSVVCRV